MKQTRRIALFTELKNIFPTLLRKTGKKGSWSIAPMILISLQTDGVKPYNIWLFDLVEFNVWVIKDLWNQNAEI